MYLSYGYAKSELGRKVDRPRTTPTWLLIAGLGSLLAAIGILAIPHRATVSELSAQVAEGRLGTVFAVACIGLGILLAIIAAAMGASRKPT